MDLFEYQARDLFAKHDVPVLAGEVIDTPEAARAATERLGGKSVVKAQVKVGGRGKAGGVKLAASADEAVEHATNILGMDIKGHTVHKVMIAETAPEIVEEYYVSFLLDRANRTFLSIASVEGGMEIEEVAETRPEAVAKTPIDANEGVTPAKAREIVEAANFPAVQGARGNCAISPHRPPAGPNEQVAPPSPGRSPWTSAASSAATPPTPTTPPAPPAPAPPGSPRPARSAVRSGSVPCGP